MRLYILLLLGTGIAISGCNDESSVGERVPKLTATDSGCADGKEVCISQLLESGDEEEVCYCWKGEFIDEEDCHSVDGGSGRLTSVKPVDEPVSVPVDEELEDGDQGVTAECPEGHLACPAIALPEGQEPECSCELLPPDVDDTVVCIGGEDPSNHPGPIVIDDTCVVGGCSGQLCGNRGEDLISTCEWRDAYACYQSARCEQQADGNCGWTQTQELQACLAGAE